MPFRDNSNPRTNIGPQADRPELPDPKRVDGLFYVSEVALSAWDSQANVWRQFGAALPPAIVLPPAGDNPGGTIVIGVITYISVQTAPGVFTYVPISGVVPPPAGALDFADFYSLQAVNVPINIGVSVPFASAGPTAPGSGILNSSPTQKSLTAPGIYQIEFQVSVTEAAQLQLYIGGVPLANSVVGRATGTDQIVGSSLITTVAPGTTVEVVNVSVGIINVTGNAGGASATSSHLVITRLQ